MLDKRKWDLVYHDKTGDFYLRIVEKVSPLEAARLLKYEQSKQRAEKEYRNDINFHHEEEYMAGNY